MDTHGAETNIKFKGRHARDAKNIIMDACNTVGVAPEYILQILEKKLGQFSGYNAINIAEWVCLCKILHLPVDSIGLGYVPYMHTQLLGKALHCGQYDLPITGEIKKIWKIYKMELHEERKINLRSYGGKLRCKIKQEFLKKDFQAFIARAFNNQLI